MLYLIKFQKAYLFKNFNFYKKRNFFNTYIIQLIIIDKLQVFTQNTNIFILEKIINLIFFNGSKSGV